MSTDIFKNPTVRAIIGILQVIVMSIATYALVEINALGKSMATLETDALRARDGLELWKEIGSIKQDVAAIPKDNPPAWFVEELRAVKEGLDRINQRIDQLASGKK